MNRLLKNSQELYLKFPDSIAGADQRRFISGIAGEPSRGLLKMISGLEIYCEGIKKQFGSPVGEDGFLGPYVQEIAQALIGLLSGPGKFDGGTLDRTIREIATDHDFYWEK